MKSLIASDDASNHLRAITALKKLCNSPKLLLNATAKSKAAEYDQPIDNAFLDGIDLSKAHRGTSGKLLFLEEFLSRVYAKTDEKIVLVSSFTQTLDVLQNLLSSKGFSFLRLDGSTPMKKRQMMVDSFNREDQKTSFVFLLSAKSGGCVVLSPL